MKYFKYITVGICSLLLLSCRDTKKVSDNVIARVGDAYLYYSEVAELIPEGATKEDSLLIVKSYMERWAKQKLLTEVAELNLSDNQKVEFEALVNQYKVDLYINAYLEELVKTSIDTLITDQEVTQYYEQNKSNFRTNGRLAKIRYLSVPENHQKINQIKEKFFNPKKSDASFWDTYLVQMNGAALNDSVWVTMNQIYQKVDFITPENAAEYIQPGKKIEHKIGDKIYLVKIGQVIPANEISPLDYIKPTIKQVILNNRKLEFINKIEKEITDDALKNNKFEIYK